MGSRKVSATQQDHLCLKIENKKHGTHWKHKLVELCTKMQRKYSGLSRLLESCFCLRAFLCKLAVSYPSILGRWLL